MSICKACGGSGRTQMVTLVKGADFPCIECNGTGEVEQTNEEWLRTATTEQLAEWIVGMSTICTINHECDRCDSWCDEKKVVEWLKQPHTNE